MGFDFASLKAKTRTIVHDRLGVQAFYTATEDDSEIEIRARWHSKIDRFGDLYDGAGYAEVVEGIDRVVLWPTDVQGNQVEFVKLGKIRFPGYDDLTVELAVREPKDGPITIIWQVRKLT